MFDWLVDTFTQYPYVGVAVIFVLCGLGLPLPEEIVLVSAGYVCFKGLANPWWMMAACAGWILAGDAVPFLLGRVFGPRLLRLRWLRVVVNRRRLAKLDSWFRRRGDLAVFFARFVPGLRVVAYFTAGTLRMRIARFLLLDISGIVLVCPPLVYVGYRFGSVIDDAIAMVQRVERGLLWTVIASLSVVALVWTVRRRRRQREQSRVPAESYIGPSVPPDDSPPLGAHPIEVGESAEPKSTPKPTQPGAPDPTSPVDRRA